MLTRCYSLHTGTLRNYENQALLGLERAALSISPEQLGLAKLEGPSALSSNQRKLLEPPRAAVMPHPDSTICRKDNGFARPSRSPYQQVKEVRLREDSQGNIEGVEYLAGLSGYDTEDDYDRLPRKASTGSSQLRSFKYRYRNGGSRRGSLTSSHRSSAGHRKGSHPTSNSASDGFRSCPSPGAQPSARFTLSSPETSGKDESTDDDVPNLSLVDGYIPRPDPSIRKSPLLNRDILRFVNDAAAGDALELDPMIFVMSMDDDSDWGTGGAGRVSPKSTGTVKTELAPDQGVRMTTKTLRCT